MPNPNPVALALQLSAAADEVTVKVWSPALRLLASETTVNVAAGWSVVALPAGFVKGAANGGYFYTISAASKGRKALPKAPGKFLILK